VVPKQRRFDRSNAALALSLVAVFFAVGGVGYAKQAVHLISGSSIKKGSISLDRLSSAAQHALRARTGPAGPRGLPGTAGGPGAAGAPGLAGVNGQNGTPGPSDIYAAGNAGVNVAGTGSTEVTSLTVPAGSYLLEASMWAVHFGTGRSQLGCTLESNSIEPRIYWGASRTVVNDVFDRASLAIAGADTFTTDQIVKVFCDTNNDPGSTVRVADIRLRAIKTGNLHATLPLLSD
jgi:hypothetical protein